MSWMALSIEIIQMDLEELMQWIVTSTMDTII